MSSDSRTIEIDFITHELIEKAEQTKNLKLIKLIFHHGCQGHSDYSCGDSNTDTNQTRNIFDIFNSIDNKNYDKIAYDSNCLIISGNIKGRTMSDSGNFTKCICNSFKKNLKKKIMKLDFNSLLVEIGRNLENKTNKSELCNFNGTLRYNRIRFEKGKYMNVENVNTNIEMVENVSKNKNNIKSKDSKVYTRVMNVDDVDDTHKQSTDNNKPIKSENIFRFMNCNIQI
eukprot:496633_1